MAGDVFCLILFCVSFAFVAADNTCDFETDLCQYTQDTADDFNWRRDSGGTPSPYTGPTVDHTTGTSSGHYMYIETSGRARQQGETARLISPSYSRYPDGQCLLFWTHMYGDHPNVDSSGQVGTLTVSVKDESTTTDIWTRSGNQGNLWFSVAVSIPATGSYQVIFEGVRGNNAHGDIAIDDVSILQETCPDVDECVPRGGEGQYSCAQICSNTVGSFSCSCDVGYTLHTDGRSCNAVQCPIPTAPEHGTVTGGNFYQDVVVYECNDGYRLIGPSSRTCQADRTWTGANPICTIVRCPTLRAPENGAVTGGNSYQDEVQFTCEPGYQLIGDSSRTCQADGTWTGENPTCTGVQCPMLRAPEHGTVTSGNSYQDVVVYECNDGYQLIGDSSRTCQADGTWSRTDPTCIGPSDITPTSLQKRALSSTEIHLTWSLSSYADQVQGYLVSVQQRGTTNVTTFGVGRSDSPSFTAQNLAPYTNYKFWVVATIGDFQSSRSETVRQRTQEGFPTVPQNVRLTNLSWSDLRVTWDGPDNFYGPDSGYVIDLYTSSSSDAVKSDVNVPQNHREYRFSGLEAATSYTVEVRANNGRNTGPPGNATARTSDGFPSSPTNISRQEDESYCDVSWSSPAVPRGNIIGYNIHIESRQGEYVMKPTTSKSIRLQKSTTTEILDLLPNSVYNIKVTGLTYTGEGNFSQTVNCTVPPGKPSEPEPPVPPNQTTSTTFPLEVKPASDRNGPIGCYHVVVVKSSSIDNLPDPEMLQTYKMLEGAKNSGKDTFAYIAMALAPNKVGVSTTVTVGDGAVTSCNHQQAGRKRRTLTSDDVYDQEYTNSPLEPDSSYTTSVRAYGQDDGGDPYFSASQYMAPVSTAPKPASPPLLIIIIASVCGGVVLLGIIAAALVCYCRKKKATKKADLSKRTGTVNKAIEMAPVDYDNINDANINDNNIEDADNDNVDNDNAVYDNVPPAPLTDFNTPIPASRLEEVYDHRHMNDNQVFNEEYQSIPEEVSNSHDAHIRPENGNKNRFKNIFTCESNVDFFQ